MIILPRTYATVPKYRVNEIPENIGMKDMDHFRDNYKKHFGKTPAHTIKNV